MNLNPSIIQVVGVFFFGGLGASFRYIISVLYPLSGLSKSGFPYHTLFINILGSFLIGLFVTSKTISEPLRPLLIIGLLGGFTTFSSFSFDVVYLVKNGAVMPAVLYVLLSVLLGILAAVLGMLI
ncbi:MAG: fluoride efflux transporter CrcB [Bacteriovoracia bacterium]